MWTLTVRQYLSDNVVNNYPTNGKNVTTIAKMLRNKTSIPSEITKQFDTKSSSEY
jgi:hypothetical protein